MACATKPIGTDDAEIACIRGDAATLSLYLQQSDQPSVDVILAIAACLLANRPEGDPGPGGWKLIFIPRNGRQTGRPKKHRPKIINAILAISEGEEIPLGHYLCRAQRLETDTRSALAEALDPDPAVPAKWQLKYAHARRSFPRTSLRTELLDAWHGREALSVYEKEGRLWKQVYHEVDTELKHVGASPTLIKKRVAKFRRAMSWEKSRKKTLD